MTKLRETVAKVAGKAKRAGAVLSNDKGILRQIKEDHGEISMLMKQVSTGSTDTRRTLFPNIRAELLAHAEAEQEVFYSELERHAEVRALIGEHIEEHRAIEATIRRLENMPMDSATWKETFDQLVQLVESHVDKEENQLFAKAKELVPEAELELMEKRFSEDKQRRLARLQRSSRSTQQSTQHSPSMHR